MEALAPRCRLEWAKRCGHVGEQRRCDSQPAEPGLQRRRRTPRQPQVRYGRRRRHRGRRRGAAWRSAGAQLHKVVAPSHAEHRVCETLGQLHGAGVVNRHRERPRYLGGASRGSTSSEADWVSAYTPSALAEEEPHNRWTLQGGRDEHAAQCTFAACVTRPSPPQASNPVTGQQRAASLLGRAAVEIGVQVVVKLAGVLRSATTQCQADNM